MTISKDLAFAKAEIKALQDYVLAVADIYDIEPEQELPESIERAIKASTVEAKIKRLAKSIRKKRENECKDAGAQ